MSMRSFMVDVHGFVVVGCLVHVLLWRMAVLSFGIAAIRDEKHAYSTDIEELRGPCGHRLFTGLFSVCAHSKVFEAAVQSFHSHRSVLVTIQKPKGAWLLSLEVNTAGLLLLEIKWHDSLLLKDKQQDHKYRKPNCMTVVNESEQVVPDSKSP